MGASWEPFSPEPMLPLPDDIAPALSSKDPSMQKTIADIESGVPAPPMSWSGPGPGIGPQARSALGIGGSQVYQAAAAFGDVNERMKRAVAEQSREEAPIEASIQAELKSMEGTKPELTVPPPFVPPTRKDLSDGFTMLTTLAALGGLLTSQPLTTALNNLTGIVNAINEGNDENFQRSYKAYEAAYKQATATNNAKLHEYQAVLNNHKISLQEKTQQLRLIAKKYGDEVKVAQLEMNQIKMSLDLMAKERAYQLQVEKWHSQVEHWNASLQAQKEYRAELTKRYTEAKGKAVETAKKQYLSQVARYTAEFNKQWQTAHGDPSKQDEIKMRFESMMTMLQQGYESMGVKIDQDYATLSANPSLEVDEHPEIPEPPPGFEIVTP